MGIPVDLNEMRAISIATLAFYLCFRTTGITPNIEKRLLCIFKFEEGDHIFIPCCWLEPIGFLCCYCCSLSRKKRLAQLGTFSVVLEIPSLFIFRYCRKKIFSRQNYTLLTSQIHCLFPAWEYEKYLVVYRFTVCSKLKAWDAMTMQNLL